MSSSTMNSSLNNNGHKRREMSSASIRKIRRTDLIKIPRASRAISPSREQEYSLPRNNDSDNRSTMFPSSFSVALSDNKMNDEKLENDSNENITSISLATNSLVSSYDSDEDSEPMKEDFHKISPVVVSPFIKSRCADSNVIIPPIDEKSNCSKKLLKVLASQPIKSSSSIKMLSNGAGLSSALRIPTKIQLTKRLSTTNENQIQEQVIDEHEILPSSTDMTEQAQSVVDYPLTPPPPIVNNRTTLRKIDVQHSMSNSKGYGETVSKRHSSSLSEWSVPPTSELSPTSLTSSSPDLTFDDSSFVEDDLSNRRISSSASKRRYRSLSFSCPVLPYCIENSKPISPPYKSKSLPRITPLPNRKLRLKAPTVKPFLWQSTKKRRRDNQFYEKRFKPKENTCVIRETLNEMIEQIELIEHGASSIQTEESPSTKQTDSLILHRSKNPTHPENDLPASPSYRPDLTRQTSTPLSFHSVISSDEHSFSSPSSNQLLVPKTHIFSQIVDELIKGAKGLDKLSCSLITFTNSIHDFLRLNADKQTEKVEHLQQELEKKCSSQLTRANIFCSKKIQYFINKHSIDQYLNEMTLIIKYFYLYILSLNCRRQENEYQSILNDLIERKLTFPNEAFSSSILTSIIEDFLLHSTLANDYLASQPMIINQIEYSLPFIRNIEYENDLLAKNEISLMTNPFVDFDELEEYLNRCEHVSTIIPYCPAQPSSHSMMYFPNYSQPSFPSSYYYPPPQSSDINPYYYSQSPSYSYGYSHHPYYNPNEQYNYYYSHPTSYSYVQPNSTGDIPLSHHQSYRRMNSNMQRKSNTDDSSCM